MKLRWKRHAYFAQTTWAFYPLLSCINSGPRYGWMLVIPPLSLGIALTYR